MKKLALIITVLCFTTGASAQTKLFDFINSVNWQLKESEFVSQCSIPIEQINHNYNDYHKTTSDYRVTGLTLGEYECAARVYVDSLSRQLHSFSVTIIGIKKDADYFQTSRDMDAVLVPILGKPDVVEEEPDNKYVKDMNRTWYKDNYTVSVMHMGFSDSQLYSLDVQGVDNSKPDFRKAKWGDSKQTIMSIEGEPDQYDTESLYVFRSTLAGMSCDVAYIFTDNKLTMAKYLFCENHTNKNDYISDYRRLVRLLTEKYGEPSWNAPEWRNSLYKDDPEDYGFAVSLGHLIYSAGWFGDKTDVSVYLTGENYEITLVIQYVSKKFEQLRENQSKQQTLDYL